MDFLVLGSLTIAHQGRSTAPSAAKDRAFLGELLAHPGELVSTEHLAEALWPDRLPADPANAVQVRASRLRTLLRSIAAPAEAETVLCSRSGGYKLDLGDTGTDLSRLQGALSLADRADTPESAAAVLREGLALWRGEPFCDVPQTHCVLDQVAHAHELRLSAMEAYAEASLAGAGVPATLIADLATLAGRNPLREPLHHRLMRALHATGRSAEALTLYERLRRTLRDELGTDPRPELRALHAEILTAEPIPWRPVALVQGGGSPEPRQEEREIAFHEGGAGREAGEGGEEDPAAAVGEAGTADDGGRAEPPDDGAANGGPGNGGGGARPANGDQGAGGERPGPREERSRAPLGFRTRRTAVAAAVIVVACLAALAAYLWWSPAGRPPEPHLTRPIPGDKSRLAADVTYPDGSAVRAGETFVKTWKIDNIGTVPWRNRYLYRQWPWDGEDLCQTDRSLRIPDTDPGQSALVNVRVQAPKEPARCKVYWKMVDSDGNQYMPHLSGIFFDVQVVP
ncbi:BTAD domain-containing putative transcriptional regulator [Streptosporangium sp. NPDC051022]|uniref:BTAD domain-containing putative transcriptional regulator n=1 Tax=Streptosporangium sp. NPDC051022 TaxID=3155752 RepID=UPI00342E8462